MYYLFKTDLIPTPLANISQAAIQFKNNFTLNIQIDPQLQICPVDFKGSNMGLYQESPASPQLP